VCITYGCIFSEECRDVMLFIADNERLIREVGGVDGGETWGTTKGRRRGRWGRRMGCQR
jgi:hypothetical protein